MDLVSAAQFLQERGYSSADRLAVVGLSAGGLLAAAAVTQRPELFAAMYLKQAVLDPLRITESAQTRALLQEIGSAQDSTAFSYLYAYAPLQHIRPGTCYPSLLAAVPDDDWRAAQSYKLVARLQSARSCERPALLYRDPPAADPVDQAADAWGFLARETGLEHRSP